MQNLSINFLDHVTLEVVDLLEAIDFYTNIIGFEILDTPDSVKDKGVQWLRLNDQQAIHIVEKSDMAPGEIAHIALNVDDVASWKSYLESKGVEITPPNFNMYLAERFFALDPSGNRVEFLKWSD